MTPVKTYLAFVAVATAAVLPVHVRPGGHGNGQLAAQRSRAPLLAPAYGTYAWPVTGPVIRPFEPPPSPYSQGHRGIDIAAPFGSVLRAANDGVVAFAGWVGGSLFISIDHPDGVRTTYSWLSSVDVSRGQSVAKGEVIGRTGHGHPDVAQPHLHFGARIGTTYIDPMPLLEAEDVASLIHLAPLADWSGTADRLGGDRWTGPRLLVSAMGVPPARSPPPGTRRLE